MINKFQPQRNCFLSIQTKLITNILTYVRSADFITASIFNTFAYFMSVEKAYYNYPIGALEIRSIDNAISHVLFVNTHKTQKVDEGSLSYSPSTSSAIKNCIQQLEEYFDGKRLDFDIEMQQPGTTFQQKVWSALCKIPCGRTTSYLQLSKNIGDVKAIRAVGTANGSNNICIIVPCHRVIGSNGDLVGYGGDLWRKKWLIAHEAKIANGVQTLF
jgi:methylated-DNA-[protein]-cysteine S-methyltransferase